MPVIVSSTRAKVIVPKWALSRIEAIHGSLWNALCQKRDHLPSFFVVDHWEKLIFRTIKRGQAIKDEDATIYRYRFKYWIGFDTKEEELIKVMHVVVKNGFVFSAYPRKYLR